jgi:hypothetical protein
LNKKLLFIFFIFIPFLFTAQNISGIVIDSTQQPIINAVVTLKDLSRLESAPVFNYSDETGRFIFKLEKSIEDRLYYIQIFNMGFENYTDTLKVNSTDVDLKIQLKIKLNSLETIVLNADKSIIIKRDTTIYNVSAFTNGNERKLKDIIRKLPGLEVDRDGNVTANGVPVNRLLIENKTFFTGDEKLGVKNIPADVIDKIELLDNYSEVNLLSRLERTGELAMNIKLKEDKKRFYFGDLSASGGVKNRYKLNPALFYYSPEKSINAIADFNNTGDKSFTRRDYTDFQGGFLNISSSEYFNFITDDFSKFLSNRDFTNSIDRFGAASFAKNKELTDFKAFVIFNDATVSEKRLTQFNYNTGDNVQELREETGETSSQFLISKLKWVHKPSKIQDLRIASVIKLNRASVFTNLISTSNAQNTFLNQNDDNWGLDWSNDLIYTHKKSDYITNTVTAKIRYSSTNLDNNWFTDRQLLDDILPLQNNSDYRIFKNKQRELLEVNSLFKKYHVLKNGASLRFSTQLDYSINSLNFDSGQIDGNQIINFSDSGFNSVFDNNIFSLTSGLEYDYEVLKGLVMRPALNVSLYYREIENKNQSTVFKGALVVPRLSLRYNLSINEFVNFNYRRSIRFPNDQLLGDRLDLTSFNSVMLGNPTLEEQITNNFSLNYSKSNLYKELNIDLGMNYEQIEQSPKAFMAQDGLDFIQTYRDFQRNENSLSTSASIAKTWFAVEFKIGGVYRYSDYYQIVDDSQNLNISRNASFYTGFKTLFKNAPSLGFKWERMLSEYQNGFAVNQFRTDRFSYSIDYDISRDLYVTFNYNQSYFENRLTRSINDFSNSRFEIAYNKENSAWTYILSGENLFDDRFRQENNNRGFIILNQTTFLQPRILMFTLSYKI